MAKTTLIKGFNHNGKEYNAGDTFEGSDQDIELLVRQNYAKKDTKPAEEVTADAGSSSGSSSAYAAHTPQHKK